MYLIASRALFVGLHWVKRGHRPEVSMAAGDWLCLICDYGSGTPEMSPCLAL